MISATPGTVLHERYRVESILGTGATGTVYRASDLAFPAAQWAVKEVRSAADGADDAAEIAAQFQQECRILTGLNHPGLPKIVDAWSEGNGHFLVMELVEGQTLQQHLEARGGRLPFVEVCPWACQALGILAYLHQQAPPIVFRDLKPSNLMVTPSGRVKLIDFGIARQFSPFKTQDTFVLGTPGFAAPEQYGTRQTDPRADIFSWAATFHYVLTGKDPELAAFRFPPAHELAADVPPHFSNLLSGCLAHEPEKRPFTAAQMLALLDEATNSTVVSGQPAPSGPRQPPVLADPSVVRVTVVGTLLMGIVARALSPSPAAGSLVGGLVLAGTVVAVFAFTPSLRPLLERAWTSGTRGRRGVVALLAGLVLLLAMPIPGSGPGLSQCQTAVRTLGVTCEMYALENHGTLPPSLEALRPRYYETLPTCPAATGRAYAYTRGQEPSGYTLSCTGSHSGAGVLEGFPQYTFAKGIVK